MPGEDRDRLFEKALARQLRADAGAGDSACLDAETLAAYHERSLAPEEMSVAKSHLVSCAHCQEIVKQLEGLQRMDEAGMVRPDRRIDTRVDTGIDARKKPEIAVAHFPAKKKILLRWAAPAGAIAAAVLLWIGMRDFRSQPKSAEPTTQVAENRSEPSRTSDFGRTTPEPAEKQKSDYSARNDANNGARNELKDEESKSNSDALRDQMPASKPAARQDLDADKKAASRAAPGSLGAAPKMAAKVAPGVTPPDATPNVAPNLAKDNSGEGAGSAGGVARKARRKTDSNDAAYQDSTSQAAAFDSAQAAAAAQNKETKLQTLAGGVPASQPPAPPPPAPAQINATAAAPMASTETVELAPLEKRANLPLMSREATSKLIVSPFIATVANGKNIWRFGEHGAIEHSTDSGKSWESQSAPVITTLTSGSAPSKNNCWVAGAAGTLLRTADGGQHWQRVITPIAGNIGGVQASDAKHASIWDATHRLSYETSDGGLTWKSASTQ